MKRLVFALLAATTLTLAQAAEAGPITLTGAISFAGSANPTGGTDWATATGIDFGLASVASSPLPTGSYLGSQGTSVTFTDLMFSPFPPAGVNPLWSFFFGGSLWTFDLSGLTSISQSGSGAGATLTLIGTGVLKQDGTNATIGLFNLTAPGPSNLGTFSFSASNVAANAVPEPGSLVLLGIGLTGLAMTVRRRTRRT